jgi:hypothetical protein
VYDEGASKTHRFFCISLKRMVQTKGGAAANPWVVYMRACAAAYRAQQQDAAPLVKSTPKRRTRKPKVTAHLAYPGEDEVLLNENVADWEPQK